MHEARLTVPPACAADAVTAAHAAGIARVVTSPATVHRDGRTEQATTISVETSTPRVRTFVDTVLRSEWFDPRSCTLSTRELRAIVNDEALAVTTRPVVEPGIDVVQDLWQLSHVTPSYAGRCAAAAILMARGVIENDLVLLILAALFLPFLSEVLGLAFGLFYRDAGLARHAIRALATTLAVSVLCGALVGALDPAPIAYAGLKGPGIGFMFSFLIGGTAGLISADDAGRRYLIGVAAAVQLGVFPVYFGIALARGLPGGLMVARHLVTFLINFTTVAATAALAYAAVGPAFRSVTARRGG